MKVTKPRAEKMTMVIFFALDLAASTLKPRCLQWAAYTAL